MEELRQQLHSQGGNLGVASFGIPDHKLQPERNQGGNRVNVVKILLVS